MFPGEPVMGGSGYVEAYLIEVKSLAGLSGSPVYVMPPDVRVLNGKLSYKSKPAFVLIGMLIGYHVVESKEDQIETPRFQNARSAGSDLSVSERNTGLAVVIPIEKILEIVEDPRVVGAMADRARQFFDAGGYRNADATD